MTKIKKFSVLKKLKWNDKNLTIQKCELFLNKCDYPKKGIVKIKIFVLTGSTYWFAQRHFFPLPLDLDLGRWDCCMFLYSLNWKQRKRVLLCRCYKGEIGSKIKKKKALRNLSTALYFKIHRRGYLNCNLI